MTITSTGSEGGGIICGDCGNVGCISTETVKIHILFINKNTGCKMGTISVTEI